MVRKVMVWNSRECVVGMGPRFDFVLSETEMAEGYGREKQPGLRVFPRTKKSESVHTLDE